MVVGDKFIITGNGDGENSTHHHFKIGETVTLIVIDDEECGGSLYENEIGMDQFVEDCHVEPIGVE